MVIGKVIRIPGENEKEIVVSALLLQDFLDKVEMEDVRKLLLAVRKNPSIVKKALKFI